MYRHFNNNPLGRNKVGDCSVRAVSKALGVSWDDAHDMLADMSKNMGTIIRVGGSKSLPKRLLPNLFYRKEMQL